MKKLASILLTAALCTTIFVSCNTATQPQKFTATLTGVDVIQIGMTIDNIPASVRGLYDEFTVEQVLREYFGEYFTQTQVHFSLSGETVMTANVSNNAIWSIIVFGTNIASVNGITPGTPIQTFLEKGGRGVMLDDDWRFAMIIDGVEYQVEKNSSGMAKREEAWFTGVLPEITLDDFDEGATIISFTIMP